MSEIKTCEQYVLAELDRTKQLLDVANDTILDLQKDLEVLRGNSKYNYREHLEPLEISKTRSYYYYGRINTKSYRDGLEKLEEVVGTDKLKESLTNDDVLEEICNTKYQEEYFWRPSKAISIDCCDYDLLISKPDGDSEEIYLLINLTSDEVDCGLIKIDDEEYSLDRDLLYSNLKEELREDIKIYLSKKEED